MQNMRTLKVKKKWYKLIWQRHDKNIYPLMILPRERVRMTCPNCLALISTRLEYHVNIIFNKGLLGLYCFFFVHFRRDIKKDVALAGDFSYVYLALVLVGVVN